MSVVRAGPCEMTSATRGTRGCDKLRALVISYCGQE